MRQFLIAVPLALVLFSSASTAYAASNFPLFDFGNPLVPAICEGKPLGVGGILTFIQNVMNAGISVGIVIFLFIIVYAGFMFILTPTNPEGHSQAKKMLSNAVIGFIIILAAWLIVDFVMKILYNGGANGFGPWNEILSSNGSQCIEPQDVVAIGGLPGVFGAIVNNGIVASPGGGGSLTTGGKGPACSGATVRAAAVIGGVQMSTNEANTIACFAGPESACGSQMKNYNWNAAKSPPPSTAWGPFQITLKGNSACFDTPACYKAAGVSGPLDCASAFTSAGYAIEGARLQQCQRAASNLTCSAVAAHCVYQKQGVSAWSGNKDSTGQHQACVANNGG